MKKLYQWVVSSHAIFFPFQAKLESTVVTNIALSTINSSIKQANVKSRRTRNGKVFNNFMNLPVKLDIYTVLLVYSVCCMHFYKRHKRIKNGSC